MENVFCLFVWVFVLQCFQNARREFAQPFLNFPFFKLSQTPKTKTTLDVPLFLPLEASTSWKT